VPALSPIQDLDRQIAQCDLDGAARASLMTRVHRRERAQLQSQITALHRSHRVRELECAAQAALGRVCGYRPVCGGSTQREIGHFDLPRAGWRMCRVEILWAPRKRLVQLRLRAGNWHWNLASAITDEPARWLESLDAAKVCAQLDGPRGCGRARASSQSSFEATHPMLVAAYRQLRQRQLRERADALKEVRRERRRLLVRRDALLAEAARDPLRDALASLMEGSSREVPMRVRLPGSMQGHYLRLVKASAGKRSRQLAVEVWGSSRLRLYQSDRRRRDQTAQQWLGLCLRDLDTRGRVPAGTIVLNDAKDLS
jgi:hypothetical protein